MKKRLNVIALSALACSFGALALTSCNNGKKEEEKCNVTFHMEGLFGARDLPDVPQERDFFDDVKKSVVKGNTVTDPLLDGFDAKVDRYTWRVESSGQPDQVPFYYNWSAVKESEKTREIFDLSKPIEKDVDLYPVLKPDKMTVDRIFTVTYDLNGGYLGQSEGESAKYKDLVYDIGLTPLNKSYIVGNTDPTSMTSKIRDYIFLKDPKSGKPIKCYYWKDENGNPFKDTKIEKDITLTACYEEL